MDSTGAGQSVLAATGNAPILFKVFILFIVGSWGWKWWNSRDEKLLIQRAAAWPLQEARVVAAQVIEEQRGEDGPSLWVGLLTYSYIVNETEIGEYRSYFSSEDQAEIWAASLRGGSVMVHVDPQDPSQSRWTPDEAEVVRGAALERMQATTPESLPSGFEILRWCTMIAALIGAILSLWVQIMILGGWRDPDKAIGGASFFALQGAAIACAISGGVLVSKRYPKRGTEAVIESLANARTRFLLKAIGGYATALFFACWMHVFFKLHLLPQLCMNVAFAAIWLIFFATSLVVCWVIGKPQKRENELEPHSRA